MTAASEWMPEKTFELVTLLEDGCLGGVRVGTSLEEAQRLLGPPELPAARLGRRSRIWVATYGNVSLLLTEGKISAIEVDFHGERTEMVRAGALEGWRGREWEEFARSRGWSLTPIADALKLEKSGFVVGLTGDGLVQSVLVA